MLLTLKVYHKRINYTLHIPSMFLHWVKHNDPKLPLPESSNLTRRGWSRGASPPSLHHFPRLRRENNPPLPLADLLIAPTKIGGAWFHASSTPPYTYWKWINLQWSWWWLLGKHLCNALEALRPQYLHHIGLGTCWTLPPVFQFESTPIMRTAFTWLENLEALQSQRI